MIHLQQLMKLMVVWITFLVIIRRMNYLFRSKVNLQLMKITKMHGDSPRIPVRKIQKTRRNTDNTKNRGFEGSTPSFVFYEFD